MYKMMTDRLQFYSDNEKSLLDSVKGTIFKAYEKTEKLQDTNKMKIAALENLTNGYEKKLNFKEEEIKKMKEMYENKIKQLSEQVELKSSQIEQMSTNEKVNQEDIKTNVNKIKELKQKIANYVQVLDKKESYYRDKINECSKQVMILTHNDKESYESISKKFAVNENDIKEVCKNNL
jgi:hypothetical protein